MRIDILTVLPQLLEGPFSHSILKRAQDKGLAEVHVHNIRDWASDKHSSIDDRPFGGGPGMVMMAPPVVECAEAVMQMDERLAKTILLTPQGKKLNQRVAEELSEHPRISLLCGRYEGIDERVLEARGVEEVSIGDYVLTGGEPAAMVLLDAVIRLRPDVLGNPESIAEESHADGLLEHPHYTRPQVWEGREIPEVLLSGHHARIAEWRTSEAERLTKERRPDLWAAHKDRQRAAPLPEQAPKLSDAQTNAEKAHKHKD